MTSSVPQPVPLTTELSTLEASCTGRILRAGDPRVAAMLGAPDAPGRHSALVVLADCVHDVGAAVRFARRAGVPTMVVGGARPGAPVPTDAVVVVVDAIAGVDVDPWTATARVGIGASWAALDDAAVALDLRGLAVAPPDAIIGATLVRALADGPADPASRSAVETVVAAQVVDATGRVRCRSDGSGASLLARAHDEGQIVTAVDLRLR